MIQTVPAKDQRTLVNRLPTATYRLQLRSDFGFARILETIPYLKSLGISDLYLSPLFAARKDSAHGYDVVDHSKIEPMFGCASDLRSLSSAAKAVGMGILLDIVPNHMGINDPGNQYWFDVLENGPHARFTHFFDIDWLPPTGGVAQKVLLPALGKSYGQALESGELTLVYDEHTFSLSYCERKFPITPSSWDVILLEAFNYLSDEVDLSVREEFLSVITHFQRLPSADERDSYYREQRIARRRFNVLMIQDESIVKAVKDAVLRVNGDPRNRASYETLDGLIQRQHYRLAFWKVAYDEINYRRFFDINDLAAIRVEDPEVFNHVHELTFQMLAEGVITGLRIDHPDGLLDPAAYFDKLQSKYSKQVSSDSQPLYVVVEKILSGDEPLPDSWGVSGTTGYEFLNQLSGILVDSVGTSHLSAAYCSRIGMTAAEAVYQGKKTVLENSMSSELSVLASRLFKIARSDRSSYDFTLPVLSKALSEWIACFSVYRTYTQPNKWEVASIDQGKIREAVRNAKIRNPHLPWSVFDYLAKVILLEFDKGLSSQMKHEWRQLALRLQQVTGPVTAKGIEDTAFYRYYPLASLNEVGADLASTGHGINEFHRLMEHRTRDWPRALSATATHDTKRGEDVRARLHVLSEMPAYYLEEFNRWDAQARSFINTDTGEVPCENERYFIHQTLIGTWPIEQDNNSVLSSFNVESSEWKDYHDRMQTYFQKAIREAKVNTSWRAPMEKHESKFSEFVNQILSDGSSVDMLTKLAFKISGPGYINSLAQVVLKSSLPGIPDFYQGTEFWDFHLVDPDNRRPVDFSKRSNAIGYLREQSQKDFVALVTELSCSWKDELKLLVTMRCLECRSKYWDIFSSGDYTAIETSGRFAQNVISFSRTFGEQTAITTVPRLPYSLLHRGDNETSQLANYCGDAWEDTAIHVDTFGGKSLREILSHANQTFSKNKILLRDLMKPLCFSILISD